MKANASICRAFGFVIGASVAFLVLTIIAMLLYPGGRVGDVNSVGYSFFANFFSDLGQTITYGGFALLLAMYVALLIVGPSASTPAGAAVQAIAQKIIVYASVATVLIQSISALRLESMA